MKLIIYATLLLLFITPIVSAEILLKDTFDGKLDTTVWNTSKPDFVYTENGMLILNQKKSGGDYVSISSKESFGDSVIYYEWFIIEWSGQGDGGGGLRVNAGGGGYYMRWWGRSNVKLTDNNKNGAIAAWTPWPIKGGGQARSNYPNTSDHFVLKAALILKEKRITVGIWDITNPNNKVQIADWTVKNDDYPRGTLHFDCWKFGIYGVDNVIVATPDDETTIFNDNFDPLKNGLAVHPAGKITTTWAKIKM
jgi:hypothetical protein